MEFRKDINGLRAIAVLAVVVFHFNPAWLSGGFAGVDVFFVISGYLMTAIIVRGLAEQKFSFQRFFIARVKRIMPALLAVCLLLLLYGWFFLPPIAYQELAKHAGSSLLFVSNMVYWHESGYFDASSLEKLLLHTWSLSVEWQFYVVYPIILMVVGRFFTVASLKKIVVALTLLGFLASLWLSLRWPTAAYFMFPMRAWEMMAGGVVCLYPISLGRVKQSLVEALGLTLIVVTYFTVDNQTVWPGYLSLLPVLGAVLLLLANNQRSFWTGNRLAQKIGLWSYSIYLVHWPILVIAAQLGIGLSFVTYLLLTSVLALACFYWVERQKLSVIVLLATLVGVLVLVGYVWTSSGASGRVDERYRLSKTEFHQKYYGGAGYQNQKMVSFGAEYGAAAYLLSGDSYALQYYRYIDEHQLRVTSVTHNGCLILPDYSVWRQGREDVGCSAEYAKQKLMMQKHPSAPMIIAQSWDEYEGMLIHKASGDRVQQADYGSILLAQLSKIVADGGAQRHYYLVGVPPKPSFNVFECMAKATLPGARLLKSCPSVEVEAGNKINVLLKGLSEKNRHVFYLDPRQALCRDGKCWVIKNGEPIYSDMGHLSIDGAALVGQSLFKLIGDAQVKKTSY